MQNYYLLFFFLILKKVKAFLFDLMGVLMKESLKKIILMALELIFGGIKESTLGIGE